MASPVTSTACTTALKLIAIIAIATLAGANFIIPLYVELQISLYGQETEASVVNVETVERDDGDRAWPIDLINYTFHTTDGYIFAGVNDANSSQTHGLIGTPDAAGTYRNARVRYVRSNPKWHRLIGWGYDGFGPPGSIPWILIRVCIVVVPVLLAYLYVYDCINRRFMQRPSGQSPG